MYTADIPCIVNGHQLMCICYADDTQVYLHLKVGKIPVVKGMVEDCISHVHRWLASNRLRLNPDKPEVMWCSSAIRAGTFDQPSLIIGHSTNSPSNVVRDLGVQLRGDLSVADQVSKVVRSCYYNIQQLRTIRSSLTSDALRDAAYALIWSRLDYCNALYLNAPMCELHRLQILINTAARVVPGRPRFDRITDFVKDVLHWLPITQRVHFKVCTLVYKATHGLAPTYLSDLVVKSTVISRRCDLRSSAHSQLLPAPHRRQFVERAFEVDGPMLWNSLPDAICDATSLTTFRRLLKGHLYNHRVWKQLVMMVITSAWILIAKRRCGLVVLNGAI